MSRARLDDICVPYRRRVSQGFRRGIGDFVDGMGVWMGYCCCYCEKSRGSTGVNTNTRHTFLSHTPLVLLVQTDVRVFERGEGCELWMR